MVEQFDCRFRHAERRNAGIFQQFTGGERGLAVMYGLRDLGCRLALDDFGTGYSSLSYLVSLPINEIKLDRSFVVAMFDSIDSLRVVRTIIDLSRDLDMLPLAEGVEDEAQREQLLALGCAAAQGYFYGKPMSLGTFVEWYREYQQSRALRAANRGALKYRHW